MRGFWVSKIIKRVQHPPRRLFWCHRLSETGSRRRDVAACWSDLGRLARVEPSSTTSEKSRKPTSPYSGDLSPKRRSDIPARR